METAGHTVRVSVWLGGLLTDSGFSSWRKMNIAIPAGDSITIQNVFGLLVMRNKNVNDGIAHVYSCGKSTVSTVFDVVKFNIEMNINVGTLTIKNNYSTVFTACIEYQNLSY